MEPDQTAPTGATRSGCTLFGFLKQISMHQQVKHWCVLEILVLAVSDIVIMYTPLLWTPFHIVTKISDATSYDKTINAQKCTISVHSI